MADRYPLIYNPSANQIQELQSGDSLDLGSSGINNVGNINSTGIITASTFNGSFTGTITGTASTAIFATTSFGLSGTPDITVGDVNSSGVVTSTSFVKTGGTSSQFLKADGTVDSSTYLTSETFTSVGIQSGGVSIGNATTLNFVGAGNTFAVNGSTIDISISGGGGGSAGPTFNELDAALFN